MFDDIIGFDYLMAFHLNDSLSKLGDKKDRHAPLTRGHIFTESSGLEILQHIKRFAITHKIPIILETNGDSNYNAYYQEIAFLKSKHTKKRETIKRETIKRNVPLNNNLILPLTKMMLHYKNLDDMIRFKAYQRAIYQIKKYNSVIINGEQLKDSDGIGKKMIDKINEILTTGTLASLQNIIQLENTSNIDELASIYGIGEAMAKLLIKRGISSVQKLKDAYDNGIINLNEQQLIGLKYYKDLSQAIPRSETLEIKKTIEEELHKLDEFNDVRVTLAGSYPSGKLESKDVDLIMSVANIKSIRELQKSSVLEDIVEFLTMNGIITDVFSLGYTKFLGIVKIKSSEQHRHLDIRLIPEMYFIPAYFYYTSGAEFNKIIREKAKRKGLKLSEWGLNNIITGDPLPITCEEDIFKHIGIPFVPLAKRR
jgi:DNA polymerase/3'-5' exonuclease PolX